jgi:hypothetical protein
VILVIAFGGLAVTGCDHDRRHHAYNGPTVQ